MNMVTVCAERGVKVTSNFVAVARKEQHLRHFQIMLFTSVKPLKSVLYYAMQWVINTNDRKTESIQKKHFIWHLLMRKYSTQAEDKIKSTFQTNIGLFTIISFQHFKYSKI